MPAAKSTHQQFHSSLEPRFLEFLYDGGYNLPTAAQNRPSNDVAVQPDFYYDPEGVPGVCVFVDGPDHDQPTQGTRDAAVREALEDKGHRIISIRYDQPFDSQVTRHPDIFGTGSGTGSQA